jgi:hypothetical protein
MDVGLPTELGEAGFQPGPEGGLAHADPSMHASGAAHHRVRFTRYLGRVEVLALEHQEIEVPHPR